MRCGDVLGCIETQVGPRHKAGTAPRNERGGFGRVALTIGGSLERGSSLAVSLWSLIGALSASMIPLVSALLSRFLVTKALSNISNEGIGGLYL